MIGPVFNSSPSLLPSREFLLPTDFISGRKRTIHCHKTPKICHHLWMKASSWCQCTSLHILQFVRFLMCIFASWINQNKPYFYSYMNSNYVKRYSILLVLQQLNSTIEMISYFYLMRKIFKYRWSVKEANKFTWILLLFIL